MNRAEIARESEERRSNLRGWNINVRFGKRVLLDL